MLCQEGSLLGNIPDFLLRFLQIALSYFANTQITPQGLK